MALRPAHPIWDSRRFWSLSDMNRFRTDLFISLAKVLGEARAEYEGEVGNNPMEDRDRQQNLGALKSWVANLDELGLRVTKLQVDRTITELEKDDVTKRTMVI